MSCLLALLALKMGLLGSRPCYETIASTCDVLIDLNRDSSMLILASCFIWLSVTGPTKDRIVGTSKYAFNMPVKAVPNQIFTKMAKT